jgi:hypothetical protein
MVGLALVGGLAVIGCSSKPSSELERMVGSDVIAIISNSDEVETFRIDPESIWKPEKKALEGMRIDGFLVISNGKTQDSAFAAKLRAILLQDETYKKPSAKCFDPGVAYRFKHGERSADVAICFMCNDMDSQPNRKHNTTGDQLADFTREARAALLALTKEAFPDDAEIQALGDQ